MNQNNDYQQDLASIRNIMERSVKFISLSGLSGILAGTYAIIGAVVAYFKIQYPLSVISYRQESIQNEDTILQLLVIAAVVLTASLITGFVLSSRKAKRHGTSIWNETSKRLFINLLIPLASGGLFILLLIHHNHYGVIAGASLIFYGLALVNACANLYDEIRYLGYLEIVLGLIAAALPGYGLLFWTIGFGVLHIIYGALMYRKYDR